METSEITAATPMIIPRVVRNDLTLLLFMALYEMSTESSGFMGLILTDCWAAFVDVGKSETKFADDSRA